MKYQVNSPFGYLAIVLSASDLGKNLFLGSSPKWESKSKKPNQIFRNWGGTNSHSDLDHPFSPGYYYPLFTTTK